MSFETDITAVKKLVEDKPLFKAAGDDAIATRAAEIERVRKEREDARKAGTDKTDFCPHCGTDLRSSDYGVQEEGYEQYYQNAYWDDRRGGWEWGDRDTSGNTKVQGYFCGKCQKDLKKGVDFDLEGDL